MRDPKEMSLQEIVDEMQRLALDMAKQMGIEQEYRKALDDGIFNSEDTEDKRWTLNKRT